MKAPNHEESRALLQVAAHPGGLSWTRAAELGIRSSVLEALVAKGLVTNRRAKLKIIKAAEHYVL